MENNKVIDKVRKCLELANNNPNENEAKSAVLQAQKLLAKYGISVADVELFEEEGKEISEECVYFKQIMNGVARAWKYRLAKIVSENFRCKYFLIKKSIGVCFYGYKGDAETAAEIFKYLFLTGNRLANRATYRVSREYLKRGEKPEISGLYNNWVEGYLNGLEAALSAQCTELALVISEDVEKAFNERIKANKKVKVGMKAYYRNNDFYNQGFAAGKETIFGTQIEG